LEPQDRKLLTCNLIHEALWKPIEIARDSFVEVFGGDPIKLRQIAVQHDLAAANQMNPAFNGCEGNRLGDLWHKLSR